MSDKGRKDANPYKKFKRMKKTYEGFVQMNALERHKAYMINDIVPSEHPDYGPGYRAHISSRDGPKYRVQLPGKYLKKLKLPDDIDFFLKDIKEGRKPYLVYREREKDNSYRIDVIEDNEEIRDHFKDGSDVPELEDSLSSIEESPEGKKRRTE